MNVRQTSIDAYIQEQKSGRLGYRQAMVLDALRSFGPHTNLELSKLLCLPINCITARTNELVKKGYVQEQCRKHCSISGRTAIVLGALL